MFPLQGNIIRVDGIKDPVYVLSKDFFNNTGEVIVCPLLGRASDATLHPYIKAGGLSGYVHCEKVRHLDLNLRRFRVVGSVSLRDRIDLADIVQAIFDYI